MSKQEGRKKEIPYKKERGATRTEIRRVKKDQTIKPLREEPMALIEKKTLNYK